MTIVDRYLLIQFFKIFLISFISFSGLYLVIHVFTNLDEVVRIAATEGGINSLVFDFYGPRVLDFFNRMAGVLILVAAVFSISLMQRRRESTATEAAGITKARLVRPVIFAAILVIAAAALCREAYIPKYKSTLVRSLTNWTTKGITSLNHHKDFETGILIQGDKLDVQEKTISEITLKLPQFFSPEILELKAEYGIIREAKDEQVGGILLVNVDEADKFQAIENIVWKDKVIVYTPSQNSWLQPDKLFVACNLDVEELAYGSNLTQYSSLGEMIKTLRKPSRRFGQGKQVAIHKRILKPFVEFTVVLLGLPLVICKPDRNIFVAAALCTMIIVGIEATSMASQAMGVFRLIPSAALAAWIPVLIFLPMTAFSVNKLFD